MRWSPWAGPVTKTCTVRMPSAIARVPWRRRYLSVWLIHLQREDRTGLVLWIAHWPWNKHEQTHPQHDLSSIYVPRTLLRAPGIATRSILTILVSPKTPKHPCEIFHQASKGPACSTSGRPGAAKRRLSESQDEEISQRGSLWGYYLKHDLFSMIPHFVISWCSVLLLYLCSMYLCCLCL